MKLETKIVNKWMKAAEEFLRPRPMILNHADRYSSETPDISLTFGGFTSWWEFKIWLRDCTFKHRTHAQYVGLLRLGTAGQAFYAVFDPPTADLHIVHPRDVTCEPGTLIGTYTPDLNAAGGLKQFVLRQQRLHDSLRLGV
jgi:hypothetical protein